MQVGNTALRDRGRPPPSIEPAPGARVRADADSEVSTISRITKEIALRIIFCPSRSKAHIHAPGARVHSRRLDAPENMPSDEYLNDFEKNPMAAQVRARVAITRRLTQD